MIPASFAPAYCAFCARVEADPFQMLGVHMNESGISATAHNPNGDASGLFQAMPDTLRGLQFRGANGYTETPGSYVAAHTRGDVKACSDLNAALAAAFRTLSLLDQIPWAEKYYGSYRGKLGSAAACYVATFLPADLEHCDDPDFVLSEKNGRRGWAFSANAGFDENHDLKIEVRELEDAIKKACHGARWEEASDQIREYMGLQPLPTADEPEHCDLSTTKGLQEALILLGFDLGPDGADGLPGKYTRLAVGACQMKYGLKVDCDPGPDTRAVITAGLAAL